MIEENKWYPFGGDIKIPEEPPEEMIILKLKSGGICRFSNPQPFEIVTEWMVISEDINELIKRYERD
jgi:hypothetical protein